MVNIKKLIVFLTACVIAIGTGYAYLFDTYASGQAEFVQDKNTDLTKADVLVTIEKSKGWTAKPRKI